MGVINKTIQVEQASDQVAQAQVVVIQTIYNAIESGTPWAEVPAMLTAVVNDLVQTIGVASQIPAEEQDNITAFIKAWANAGVDIAGIFLQKKALAPGASAPAAV